MRTLRLRFAIGTFTIFGVLGVLDAFSRTEPCEFQPVVHAAQAKPSAAALYTGMGDCSRSGCHGAAKYPDLGKAYADVRDSTRIKRDESLIFLTKNLHSQAARVLTKERSQKIASNLAKRTGAKLIPAHEDKRCLACHAIPELAESSALAAKLRTRGESDPTRAATILRDGVSCEACHGPATEWVEPHKNWGGLAARTKEQQFSFYALDDLARRAEVCAGCHIGSAPDKAKNLPPRDCNHDIMAAGHPRLSFEFALFQSNLPPHWNDSDKGETFSAQSWAIGQAAVGLAWLDLLKYRAETPTSVWPEFAEYNCYACHHKIAEPSHRTKPGYYASRSPGALPWASWFLPMHRLLASGGDTDGAAYLKTLGELENAMTVPVPDKPKVAALAGTAASQLKKWAATIPGSVTRSACEDWLANLSKVNENLATESWDSAFQHYAAIWALQDSVTGPGIKPPRVEAINSALDELLTKLTRGVFESPEDYNQQPVSQAFKLVQSRLGSARAAAP